MKKLFLILALIPSLLVGADVTVSSSVDTFLQTADVTAMRSSMQIDQWDAVAVSTNIDYATATHAGKLLQVDASGGARTITINSGEGANEIFSVMLTDATNAVTITAGASVTISGTAALSVTGKIITVWHSDTTNTWEVFGNEPLVGVSTYEEKHAASHTLSFDETTGEGYGSVHYVTSAATLTLPAVSDGASYTIITIGAIAVSLDTNASDLMYLDGTALDDGDKATNTSTAGDIITATYYDATGWYCASNSWTDGGP